VNDILDTAKLDEGKLEVVREPVDITAFLNQLKLSFSGMAGQKNLYLELDNTLPDQFAVLADPFRLQQIFSNLLSNALKFTEQGGITIKAQKVAAGMSIRVQDTGIGITAEQKDKLFAAFSQADVSTSRRYGGTGLGLYICKSLADLMGLTLEVSSTSGLGTCFTLSFPPALLDETGLTLNSPENTSGSISRNWQFSGNILIVDDVREIRQLLRRQLQSPGIHISEAEDGNVALTLAKQQVFDLIILDQQMPGLDGFETAKLLRQQGSVAKLVSLSADIYDRSQLNQAENPFDLIMAKPINQQRLLEQLQQLFAANTENSQVLPPKQLIAVQEMDLELVALQQDYLRHLEPEITHFRALIAAQSWADLKKASHKLKGTSASLELVDLAEIALDFDTAVAEKVNPQQLLFLCRRIEQQLNIQLTKTLNKHS
jgi:CheY-like chemotaxis protein/anti-sigma regulatory factor (Ser/Thr protein kinase)